MREERNSQLNVGIDLLETWIGSLVRVEEWFSWIGDDRPISRPRESSFFQMYLENLQIIMGSGAVQLCLKTEGGRADFGILMDRVVSVDRTETNQIEFIEALGSQVWRRSRITRLSDESIQRATGEECAPVFSRGAAADGSQG